MNFKQKSAYDEMLAELGIDQRFSPEPEESLRNVYSDDDYEYEHGGLHHSMVGRGGPNFGLEYEDVLRASQKKIHRYNRVDRLKFTLCQLAGISGDVPQRLIEIIKLKLKTKNPNKIWNSIRKILKKAKLRKYYNRIPLIIKHLTGKVLIGFGDNNVLDKILQRFKYIHILFNSTLKNKWERKYFLNMRYLSLKLIQEQGCIYPYHIPTIRTSRKKKYLDNLFSQISNEVL